jgi:methionyl-tRNA synthetase
MSNRRILVTSALPYANGHIHLGHLVEYLQSDMFVRFQKAMGRDCRYFCADDTHGTAIMIRARQEGTSEQALIDAMSVAHQRDFAAFGIEFDHYGSTHSDSNRELCGVFWDKLKAAGRVVNRDVTQLYDTVQGVFLADRFVKGTCPRCKATDQYGDNCEKCGATYNAADLIDPKSTLSGSTPELRTAPHSFVQVEQDHEFLAEWTQSGERLQPEIANYLNNFFLNNPLRDWDVSRPAPYFGFEIPDQPGNYWYVWFDAPIGYLASTKDWCNETGANFDDWWRSPDTDIYHVIGKDIVYFHTLFWPAMLRNAGFSLPTRVHVHGFLTVNGEKMSKSRGTQIQAATYLEHLDPAYLRYYYASKLGPGNDDLDLDFVDFPQKVNSDIVGKVVNLASRSARFIADVGLSATYPEDGGLFAAAAALGDEIAKAYEAFDTAKAMRLIMSLADKANEYVDRMQPWSLRKQAGQEQALQDVCTVSLNLYRQLVVYLSPVLPQLAADSAALLNASTSKFVDAKTPTLGHSIGEFKPLMQRVDPKAIEKLLADSQPEPAPAADAAQSPAASFDDSRAALDAEPLAEECSIDDFGKVDLRVARIVSAEPVPEANKLLRLQVSLGGDERRTVFAGIKSAYSPEQLIGRLVVLVANLKPRKMKFGTSEGMVIAAGPGGKEIFLLSPDSGAVPGQRVH